MKKFTVEIQIDLEVDEKALAEIMSEKWQSDFYYFCNEEEAAQYLARLFLMTGRVHNHDGHSRAWKDLVKIQSIEDGYYRAQKEDEAIAT